MFHIVRGNDVIYKYDVTPLPLEKNINFSEENVENGKIFISLYT